ncbi:MAG TPA: diadenylate cyclase CdaA [Armatimonadota bacterium]|jgi:diadenylate cyclase
MHRWLQMVTTGLPPMDARSVLVNVVDILLVSALIYQLLMWARGTRAWQIMWGILVYLAVLWVSTALDLSTLAWILQKFEVLGPVAIVILFFPELRHVLEEMGRIGFWGSRFRVLEKKDVTRLVDEIVRSAVTLSAKSTGALIVIERETGLNDYIASGRILDASLSSELLGAIFYPGGPLHDGAVIVRGDKVVAAGCVLPLTSNPGIGTSIHTRHRAALGTTEQSDAVVVVVSEETGAVSVSHDGRLIRGLREDSLRERLIGLLEGGNGRPAKKQEAAA